MEQEQAQNETPTSEEAYAEFKQATDTLGDAVEKKRISDARLAQQGIDLSPGHGPHGENQEAQAMDNLQKEGDVEAARRNLKRIETRNEAMSNTVAQREEAISDMEASGKTYTGDRPKEGKSLFSRLFRRS